VDHKAFDMVNLLKNLATDDSILLGYGLSDRNIAIKC